MTEAGDVTAERRSVAGIAVEDGKVFAARRLEKGDIGGKWEFPGGKVRYGESDGNALIREYAEEFSVPVEPGPSIGEAQFIHNHTRFTLSACLVRFVKKDFSLEEHSAYRWLRPEELDAMDFADSDRLLFPFVTEAVRSAAEHA